MTTTLMLIAASKQQSTSSNSKQGAQVSYAGWWHGSNFRVTYIYFSSSLNFRLTTFEIASNCCLNISGVSGTLCFSHSDFRTPHRNIGMTGFTEIPGIPISVPNYFRFPDLIAECRKPEMPTKSGCTTTAWFLNYMTLFLMCKMIIHYQYGTVLNYFVFWNDTHVWPPRTSSKSTVQA